MRTDAPPQLRVLGDGAGVVEEADVALEALPTVVPVRHTAAGEETGEDLRAGRVQPGYDVLDERRARGQRQQLGEERTQPVVHGDRAISAANADVDVESERVVSPDDVAEQLVVSPVVRRVDDPLVLPVRPRMRAGGTQGQLQRLDQPRQLR